MLFVCVCVCGWMACQASSDIYKMNCSSHAEEMAHIYALCDAGSRGLVLDKSHILAVD